MLLSIYMTGTQTNQLYNSNTETRRRDFLNTVIKCWFYSWPPIGKEQMEPEFIAYLESARISYSKLQCSSASGLRGFNSNSKQVCKDLIRLII